MTDPTPIRPARVGLGVLYALVGHAVVIGAAIIARLIVKPAPGGGFQDLAAVTATALGGEILLGLVCLVAGGLRFRRGDRELGLGLVAGWIVGLVLLILIVKITS